MSQSAKKSSPKPYIPENLRRLKSKDLPKNDSFKQKYREEQRHPSPLQEPAPALQRAGRRGPATWMWSQQAWWASSTTGCWGVRGFKGEPMLPLRVWTLQKVPQRSESASTQLKMTVHSSTSVPARVLTEQAFDVAREMPPPLWSGLKCEFSKRGRNRAKTALCTARL